MSCPGCGQSLSVAPLIRGHMVLPANCLARQISMVGTDWAIHLDGHSPLPLQQRLACRQEAVPALVAESAGLAASQLFYLLWEVDQGSGPGLVHWSISLASVGAGYSRVNSQTGMSNLDTPLMSRS